MSPEIPIESIAGHRVLFVMATDAEYGPALRARIKAFRCGVGPVESGVAVAAALAMNPVDLVVSMGSAGSNRLDHCGLYQIREAAYRDMDASPFGFPVGVTPFSDLPRRLPLPLRLPGLPEATISTGAGVAAGPQDYEKIEEQMVDMETWAILRACMRFDTPMIGLRGISDGHTPVKGLACWTDYLHVIDAKLGDAVDSLPTAIAAGLLARGANHESLV
ncbi:MAG: 5'-methylthioadenosine/S-adenosylhomocysteine nucleosidase [Luteolibacter sp.]